MLRIALRNLLRNRRRTLLTLAAIAIGVTAVVSVRGLLNGLQRMLVTTVAEGQMGGIQLHAKGYMQSVEAAPLSPNLTPDDALLQKITSVEGVIGASPRIAYGGMVSLGDDTIFAILQAVDPVRELQALPKRTDALVDGQWLDKDGPSIVLSSELTKAIHAKSGDKAAILTNDVDGVMNAIEAPLRGQVAAGVQGEKRLAIISLAQGQELLRMPGKATEIVVGVKDPFRVEEVATRLRAVLPDTIEVHTWKDLAKFADDAVATQNAALRVITAIFLFVILLGVANTLLMSVMERVREIGTMMALGARRKQILRLFLFEASLLGAAGALLGIGVGNVIVFVLSQKGLRFKPPGATLPTTIHPFSTPGFMLYVLILCTIGASIAALYPALKASRMRPVEALTRV